MRELARRGRPRERAADALERRPCGRIQRLLPRGASKKAEARTGARLHGERDILERGVFGQDGGDLERASESEPRAPECQRSYVAAAEQRFVRRRVAARRRED